MREQDTHSSKARSSGGEDARHSAPEDLLRGSMEAYFDRAARGCRIDSTLIMQRCVENGERLLRELSHDEIAARVLEVRRLTLDRLHITHLDNLECYTKVTHVFLQHNKIKDLNDQFHFMSNLSFLVLSNNMLSAVGNLRHLDKLQFLDVSHNRIEQLDVGNLPLSLRVLNIAGNPCAADGGVRQSCVEQLPRLETMDDVRVRRASGEHLQEPEPGCDKSSDDSEQQSERAHGNSMYLQLRQSLESLRLEQRETEEEPSDDDPQTTRSHDLHKEARTVLEETLQMRDRMLVEKEKLMRSALGRAKRGCQEAARRMVEASAARRARLKEEAAPNKG